MKLEKKYIQEDTTQNEKTIAFRVPNKYYDFVERTANKHNVAPSKIWRALIRKALK